jgi:RNA polymerase sigma-32 factor
LKVSDAWVSLSAEEEFCLIVEAQAGNQKARDKVILHHAPLVYGAASKMTLNGLKREDFISEGFVGLIKALDKFDLEKGWRFSTYARWWVKACCYEFLLKNYSLVKLGTTPRQKRLFFNLVKLQTQLGENNFLAIAEVMGVSPDEVAEMVVRTSGDADCTETLDVPAGLTPEESLVEDSEQSHQHKAIQKALLELDVRERIVLQGRHLSEVPRPMDAIAAEFGVSQGRVRQLEKRALDKFTTLVEFNLRSA